MQQQINLGNPVWDYDKMALVENDIGADINMGYMGWTFIWRSTYDLIWEKVAGAIKHPVSDLIRERNLGESVLGLTIKAGKNINGDIRDNGAWNSEWGLSWNKVDNTSFSVIQEVRLR